MNNFNVSRSIITFGYLNTNLTYYYLSIFLQFKLLQTADGSGKGAALITAVIARLNKQKEQKQQQIMGRKEELAINRNQKANLMRNNYDSFEDEVENGMIDLSNNNVNS